MIRTIENALTGWRGGAALLVLVVVLALLPAVLPSSSYILYLLFTFFIFAAMGHGWNLLAGYCGLLSFGNQAFVGIGGFSLAILFYYGGVNVWVALLLSGVVSALFAFLLSIPIKEKWLGKAVLKPAGIAVALWLLYELAIVWHPALDIFGSAYIRRVLILLLIFLGGLPLLRLQGAYFAVATWLVAASIASVFNEWRLVGAGGGMQIKSDVQLPGLYLAALLLLGGSTAVIWRLLRSRYGLALTAVRDDEEAARTVGIDIALVKMFVFVLSGAVTGLAAGLYYMNSIIITAPGAFTVIWSAYFVFVVVAGGMGTIAGPIIGAAIYVIVEQLLTAYLNSGTLVLGAASIIIIFVMPRGVMGLLADLRGAEGGRGRSIGLSALRLLLGVSERTRGQAWQDQPGVVAAFLVTGSPLPLMRGDNPPWKALAEGFEAARKSLAAARPDAILVYSTQWIAVLDQLWQARPRIAGLHVDDDWHDLGNLRFDIRTDTTLVRDCVAACAEAGIKAKAVDYDSFPIDTGTIIAQNFLNPHGQYPLVIAANNIYHDFETTRRLGAIAAAQALARSRRVAVIGIGNLSGTMFRTDIAEREDRIARDVDDVWNRDILRKMVEGKVQELTADLDLYVREARPEMGFKHFAWIFGAIGGQFRGAVVHAYGPAWGAGAAVVEFKL
jgi:ABC-type branched-subunit amino acid transport system permease subunit/aromatic ring-opening dioxygenase catalytic subunit (LigB family)